MPLELDKEIGQRLGYKAKLIDTNAMTGREIWALLDPTGQICGGGQAVADSEQHVWERHFPAYSSDVNAAMELLPPGTDEQTFLLRQYGADWLATITDTTRGHGGSYGSFEGIGATPAEAVCKAWLAWEKG